MKSEIRPPQLATASTPARSSQTQVYLHFVSWILAIALGALHAWAAARSHSMNEDGISYLDIGDAYMRGDWGQAINAVWSPVYSWLLGLLMVVVKPSVAQEFPLVHTFNFAIYVTALFCFTFFWRQLMQYRRERLSLETSSGLPDWAMWSLGYALFIWTSLGLVRLWSVTPDMLVAAIVYLVSGLIVRLRRGRSGWLTFVLIGGLLGLAYLSKTVMLPAGFFFLAAALFSVGDLRRALPRVLVAALIFLLVAAPFILAISAQRGRLTIGDAGQITYLRYVNGIPYPHWQGGDQHGSPEHGSRQIYDNPPIYEFGSPIDSTYPISYDPVYWYEGATFRFDLGQQLNLILFSSLPYYLDLFVYQQGGLIVAAVLLYLIDLRRLRTSLRYVAQHWSLLIPALAVLSMYGLAGAITGRYIGPFVVILWADLLAGIDIRSVYNPGRVLSIAGSLMLVFMLVVILFFNLQGLSDLRGAPVPATVSTISGPPAWPGEVALALHASEVEPGDSVAVIGSAFEAFWARLARVNIVAEMFAWEADPFWLGTASEQARAIAAFESTGAAAIVAEYVPSYARMDGWQQVGDSSTYIYVFDDPTRATQLEVEQ